MEADKVQSALAGIATALPKGKAGSRLKETSLDSALPHHVSDMNPSGEQTLLLGAVPQVPVSPPRKCESLRLLPPFV